MKQEKTEKRSRVTWGDVFPQYKISMIDNGRMKRIRVEGAKKLLLCIEKEVKILFGEEVLRLVGGELSCVNYAGGAIEITGRVHDMSFEKRNDLKEKKG